MRSGATERIFGSFLISVVIALLLPLGLISLVLFIKLLIIGTIDFAIMVLRETWSMHPTNLMLTFVVFGMFPATVYFFFKIDKEIDS